MRILFFVDILLDICYHLTGGTLRFTDTRGDSLTGSTAEFLLQKGGEANGKQEVYEYQDWARCQNGEIHPCQGSPAAQKYRYR